MLNRFRALLSEMFRKYWPPAEPFEDPYAGVRVPRRGGPPGRSSAVAVREPEPYQFVEAAGRQARPPRSR